MNQTVFEKSTDGRCAHSQVPAMNIQGMTDLHPNQLRKCKPALPELSELQVVRHFTQLSRRNFSIDTHFYPLGSCTMKYNPRGVHKLAMQESILAKHPLAPVEVSQAWMQCLYELQEMLSEITGMPGVALSPMAGAQGEFAGVAMIRAYHQSRGDFKRNEILVPDAAHGTNPASAVQCGFMIKEIPTEKNGNLNLTALKNAISDKTAGIMLTNPSTLGVFESDILMISEWIHQAGGLLYYDGANFNAVVGRVRSIDMGFDVMHLNLHKTFATPHGGGGPGSGPVTVCEKLMPFLPVPRVIKVGEHYQWLTEKESPQTIGRLTSFCGNAGILLRAYFYMKLLGREGIKRISRYATLNANYLLKRLSDAGFEAAFPDRLASHEFILTLKNSAKETGVTALDIAKRLLDYGFHAPTMYFPLLVPECLLIEPTETEDKQTLDQFVDAMIAILREQTSRPELLKNAPHTLPVRRLDEVKAARELKVAD